MRRQYGFDKPPVVRYFYWLGGMLHGDFGYSFEYQLPVSEVVGDRLWLTILVSFCTIILTWLIAFPIGMYSATHQYSWGDYGFSVRPARYCHSELHAGAHPHVFRQYLVRDFHRSPDGLEIYCGTHELGKGKIHPRTFMDSGAHCRNGWNRRHDPATARQSSGRIAEAICHDGTGQGTASIPRSGEISASYGAQFLRGRHRLHIADHHIGRRNHCDRAVAGNHRANADQGTAKSGYVSGRVFPDVSRVSDSHRNAHIRHRAGGSGPAYPVARGHRK